MAIWVAVSLLVPLTLAQPYELPSLPSSEGPCKTFSLDCPSGTSCREGFSGGSCIYAVLGCIANYWACERGNGEGELPPDHGQRHGPFRETKEVFELTGTYVDGRRAGIRYSRNINTGELSSESYDGGQNVAPFAPFTGTRTLKKVVGGPIIKETYVDGGLVSQAPCDDCSLEARSFGCASRAGCSQTGNLGGLGLFAAAWILHLARRARRSLRRPLGLR